MSRDQQICSSLEEKLQVYASLSALSGRMDGLTVGPQLLVQPQWEEPPLQAAALLAAAVKEGRLFQTVRCVVVYLCTGCRFFSATCVIKVGHKHLKDLQVGLFALCCLI